MERPRVIEQPDGTRWGCFAAQKSGRELEVCERIHDSEGGSWKQCGHELARENVMRQAASLKDLELPMLLPGIRVNTTQTDYYPVEQLQPIRFDGTRWVRFGEVMGR